MKTRTSWIVAAALLATGAGVTAAVATPGSGNTVVTRSVTGVLDDSDERRTFKAQQDGVKLMSTEPTSVTSFDLEYPPGSFSGWHSHPGIVVAVVRSGEVVRQTGCTSERFGPGDSFTEVGPHHVSNPSTTTPAVLAITRIYPTADAAEPRIDEPAPVC